MQAVLRNDRLDGGKLPDLMPLGCLGIADERTTTPTASIGMALNDLIALLRRDHFSGMFFMALLSAAFPLRLGLLVAGLIFVVVRVNGA